jgi:hypothetical protein
MKKGKLTLTKKGKGTKSETWVDGFNQGVDYVIDLIQGGDR